MSAKAFLQRYRAALSYRTNLERIMREEYREAIARAQGIHGQQGSQDALLGVKVQSAPQGRNLPAPGRRQPIYLTFRFRIDLCFC